METKNYEQNKNDNMVLRNLFVFSEWIVINKNVVHWLLKWDRRSLFIVCHLLTGSSFHQCINLNLMCMYTWRELRIKIHIKCTFFRENFSFIHKSLSSVRLSNFSFLLIFKLDYSLHLKSIHSQNKLKEKISL